MQKIIAVCGAPVSGKISLVLQLCKMIPGSHPTPDVHDNFYRRLVHVPVIHSNMAFHFKCLPGAFFDIFDEPHEFITKDFTKGYALYGQTYSPSAARGYMNPLEEMYTPLLLDADLILYVISSDPDRVDFQVKWFQRYRCAADRLQKLWTHIPWIFVLNKVDRSTENPLVTHLPVQDENEILHTIGVGDGFNIDRLWTRILQVFQL